MGQPAPIRSLRAWALALGPLLALAVYSLLPPDLDHRARAAAAVAALMALWWLTEAIPISATALLPVALFPLLGVQTTAAAAAPYADKVIFLFLGGFLLGLAMQRWGLHTRIALVVILLVGTSPARLIAGFMIATAACSAWVSNTATAAMMVPIGASLIALLADHPDIGPRRAEPFARAVMLAIAYAASIGGVATLIGTPPNGVLKGFLEAELGVAVSFQSWMLLGLPVAAVMLPCTWLYLTRFAFRSDLRAIPGGRAMIRQRLRDLGPLSQPERAVLLTFTCTALAWVLRPQIVALVEHLRPGTDLALTDEGIAVLASLALFIIPARTAGPPARVLDWRTAEDLPYGILILFGGGLSLAAAIKATGLDAFLGQQLGALAGAPPLLISASVALLVVFATELTSNTALTAALLPVLAGAAPALGIDPLLLLVPATLCASFAFMLPVATPPNAIVFSTGHLRIAHMARTGFALNLLGVLVVTALTYALAPHVLGPVPDPPTIDPTSAP